MPTTTGIELKIERVKMRVKAQDLAAEMKVSRATVWMIERSAHVDSDRALQYRAALAELGDVSVTSGATA